MMLQHRAALSVELLEQFGAAVENSGLYSVKLDGDELKALGGFLVSTAKKTHCRLDRQIMMSLYEHFKTMESLIREL
jgi:hypothetical protein